MYSVQRGGFEEARVLAGPILPFLTVRDLEVTALRLDDIE